MGWETRQRGRRYYTRARRAGGLIVREYIGTGRAAELVALLGEREREELDAARAEDRERRAKTEAADLLIE